MKQRGHKAALQALRTTPPPPGLGAWIDAVNGLPADPVDLMLIANGIQPLWAAQANGARQERTAKIRNLRERTAGWGRSAAAYVFRRDTDPQEPGERLSELVSAWVTLRHVAALASNGACGRVMAVPDPPGAGARLISDHGVLRVEVSPFLAMLNGIEAERIRLCPICQKLFWAGRRDKSACSLQCAGAFRQRKLRENRAYKKNLLRKGMEKRDG